MIFRGLSSVGEGHALQLERGVFAAFDQATEALAILDAADGCVLHANTAFMATFGNSDHWIPRQKLLELFQMDEDGHILAAALEQARSGQTWMGRSFLKTQAGRGFTFEGALSPVRNREGAIESLVVRLRDITTELEKDRQLRQAQKMEALGALAGGVAHDFNNLICAILNAAGHIEIQTEPGTPLRRKVEIIQQVSGRAQELSAQILNYSRRTDGKGHPIDLSALVTEVANLLQITLPKNVVVQCESLPGIKVLGDPSQLHQVLMNLGINASQAMQPDGGTLSIHLQDVLDEPGSAGQLFPEPRIRLTVEDTGCGMDSLTLERIFEPFFTTKEAGHGTGLGLSVVHGIIREHGGELQVTSQPGQGSSFQISLPVYQDGSAKLSEMAAEPHRRSYAYTRHLKTS